VSTENFGVVGPSGTVFPSGPAEGFRRALQKQHDSTLD
jgi:hypothetical protein